MKNFFSVFLVTLSLSTGLVPPSIASAQSSEVYITEHRTFDRTWDDGNYGSKWDRHRHPPRQPVYHHSNDDGSDIAVGVLGLTAGILLGSALADSDAPNPRRGVIVRPAYTYQNDVIRPWTRDWYRFCLNRYRSFDPDTGTYYGSDGARHFCRIR